MGNTTLERPPVTVSWDVLGKPRQTHVSDTALLVVRHQPGFYVQMHFSLDEVEEIVAYLVGAVAETFVAEGLSKDQAIEHVIQTFGRGVAVGVSHLGRCTLVTDGKIVRQVPGAGLPFEPGGDTQ